MNLFSEIEGRERMKLETFLREHGVEFNADRHEWVIYGRYFYKSLKMLLYKENLDILMTNIYRIDKGAVDELEFHTLHLVKN